MIRKMAVQLSCLSRSKDMNPPKTTRMAIRGIMELTPSAIPRFVSSVLSVSQALYAASFAVEPKKVMTQSRMMVREMPICMAEAAMGNRAPRKSIRRKAKPMIEMPQII